MKKLKEKAILLGLGLFIAYAAAVAMWFTVQKKAWLQAEKSYRKQCAKFEAETKLISEKSKWIDAYESEKSNMPIFDEGKSTDTTWLLKMDEIAAEHKIDISVRQAGKEVEAGEVMELPIDVKNWEGSWEALLRFLHTLETKDDGMFDIRAISFKPSGKKGYLKGSFTLTCAYMRR
jgi:hypothetical protein